MNGHRPGQARRHGAAPAFCIPGLRIDKVRGGVRDDTLWVRGVDIDAFAALWVDRGDAAASFAGTWLCGRHGPQRWRTGLSPRQPWTAHNAISVVHHVAGAGWKLGMADTNLAKTFLPHGQPEGSVKTKGRSAERTGGLTREAARVDHAIAAISPERRGSHGVDARCSSEPCPSRCVAGRRQGQPSWGS
jgi:hypothetical protein